MRRILAFLLFLTVMIAPLWAQAQTAPAPTVGKVWAGVNGIWCSAGDPIQADIEAAVNGAASLSPHLSAVAAGEYGFSNAYFRGSVGARATATDVTNQDFSVGLGISYHVASAHFSNEWAPEVAVGYRPWPARWPNLTAVGLGWYGLDSKQTAALVGLRWRVNL